MQQPSIIRQALTDACRVLNSALPADKIDAFPRERAGDAPVVVGVSDTPTAHRQRALGLDRIPLSGDNPLVSLMQRGALTLPARPHGSLDGAGTCRSWACMR